MTSYRDPAIPSSSILFRPVYDVHGLRLALVLGNQAPRGICPYAQAQRCHHCDIGLGEGVRFSTQMNLRRLDWFETYYASILPNVCHLVIYNSGSTLNPAELALEVWEAIFALVQSSSNLKIVSVDSREAFVQHDILVRLVSLLGRGYELRIILGVESANDRIRNKLLDKQMSRQAIDAAAKALTVVSTKVENNTLSDAATLGFSVNILVGGPGTTAYTAVNDAVATAAYGVRLAESYNLSLDLNLHPYYPSQRGRARFPAHPRPLPKVVCDAACTIAEQFGDKAVIFLGWQDEGHDQEPTRRAVELSTLGKAVDHFNKTGLTTQLRVAWRQS